MVQVLKEWYSTGFRRNGIVYVGLEGIWYGAGLEGRVWYRFRRNGMVQV